MEEKHLRKKLLWIRVFFMVSLLLGALLGARSESPPVFTDVTAEAGITFHHRFGDEDMA